MRCCLSITLILAMSHSVFAQVAVQQPVVGVTSLNTSVMVPDQGSTFLGGVSSAQSGRSQYGPLRAGTSTGFSRQSTSFSANVSIIDLHEMDQSLLNSSPESSRVSAKPTRNEIIRMVTRPVRDAESRPVDSPAQKAAKFEGLARNAEKAGKTSVARLYWQAAESYGSQTAKERMFDLTKPSPAPGPESTIQ